MWQNLPQTVTPIAFSVGPLTIYWYALMWLCAFFISSALLYYRFRRGEGQQFGFSPDYREKSAARSVVSDIFFNTLLGALLGGRVGYVLFYNFSYFLENPLSIISPYDFATQTWTGIMGMSYHGGAIGVIIALVITARTYKLSVFTLADFIVPIIGAGYFFGRIGNFFNGELVGRVTEVPWGMYFLSFDASMRHPSQLYEAMGEGIVIFAILWTVRNRNWGRGVLSGLYIALYGSIRFFLEYFRQPDEHIGLLALSLSMGQILSLTMILGGIVLIYVRRGKS